MQRLWNELADTLAELEEFQAIHSIEKEELQDKILTLEANLARERAESAEAICKLT